MDKRFIDMRHELYDIANKEAMKLWRLARKAQKHGVSKELINNIREEANTLYYEMKSYPDRLLSWNTHYRFKYAFKLGGC